MSVKAKGWYTSEMSVCLQEINLSARRWQAKMWNTKNGADQTADVKVMLLLHTDEILYLLLCSRFHYIIVEADNWCFRYQNNNIVQQREKIFLREEYIQIFIIYTVLPFFSLLSVFIIKK